MRFEGAYNLLIVKAIVLDGNFDLPQYVGGVAKDCSY